MEQSCLAVTVALSGNGPKQSVFIILCTTSQITLLSFTETQDYHQCENCSVFSACLDDLGSAFGSLPQLSEFPEGEQKALLIYQGFYTQLAANNSQGSTIPKSDVQSKYEVHNQLPL